MSPRALEATEENREIVNSMITSEFQLGFSQLEPWYIYNSLTNRYREHVTSSMEW